MKIDIYPHILPAKYLEAFQKENKSDYWKQLHNSIPTLSKLDYRFRIMDKYEGLMQVLTLASPPLEEIGNPQKSLELARIANDEMAELVLKYPDKFAAAVAALPMDNLDNALNEVDRAIKDLHCRGVQIYTPIKDKPLDSPEFFPLYEKMCEYDLPIWVHPHRPLTFPDYKSEDVSKYNISATLGWVYETSVAMFRLVISGVLERYPKLKFITHHGGAMMPFLERRLISFINSGERLRGESLTQNLKQPAINYFKMFYADTAIYGHTAGLMCSHDFYGARHLLFGTDMPFENLWGLGLTGNTIESIEKMAISDSEKKMIFEDNARNLLRLAV